MRGLPLRVLLAGLLVVSLSLAGVVSYYASGSPDGLERVAEDEGFLDTRREHPAADSPLAGYATEGVENSRLSTGLAGLAGAAVVLALTGGLVLVLRRRRGRTDDGASVGTRS